MVYIATDLKKLSKIPWLDFSIVDLALLCLCLDSSQGWIQDFEKGGAQLM